jgi:RimJ/RimL family protein N-acetyltransferase
MLQPILSGQLVRLRPLAPDDFEPLYQAASDPLIWEQHPQNTRYQRAVFAQYFAAALKSQGALLVLERATGRVIGCSRYYDRQARQITIGYTFLIRACWGGRYNGEMKKLMLDHAFRQFDRVLFEIGEHNLRSQTAIERLGAQRCGKRLLDGKVNFIYRLLPAANKENGQKSDQ